MATILLVDDDPQMAPVVRRLLQADGHLVLDAPDAQQALVRTATVLPDLLILDHELPGLSGLDLLAIVKDQHPTLPVVMLTGHGTVDRAVEAMRAGAADYVTKPFETVELRRAVLRGLELGELRRQNAELRRDVDEMRRQVAGAGGARAIIGRSLAIEAVRRIVAMAAPTRATVLLQGESGTGKELFARALHEASDRRGRPFVDVNCAAIPESLVESLLFGHERGAFTGATRRVEGAFERADRGTLLLDEISEMRLDLQAKLLRVLQEQEFERVGGSQRVRVDVRVVATTNRDLAAEVAAGRFRADLYHRLNVIAVRVPPLRERAEDVPALAAAFAARAAAESGRRFEGFGPGALELLCRHRWPGNVRELQHALERAVILSPDPTLTVALLRGVVGAVEAMPGAPAPVDAAAPGAPPPLASFDLAQAEQRLVEGALAVARGNRTRAAALLGINVRTLRKKLNGHAPATPVAD